MNIIQGDVFKFIGNSHSQWDYIFAGPPYGLGSLDSIPDLIFEKKMLKEEGWFVLEHNRHFWRFYKTDSLRVSL